MDCASTRSTKSLRPSKSPWRSERSRRQETCGQATVQGWQGMTRLNRESPARFQKCVRGLGGERKSWLSKCPTEYGAGSHLIQGLVPLGLVNCRQFWAVQWLSGREHLKEIHGLPDSKALEELAVLLHCINPLQSQGRAWPSKPALEHWIVESLRLSATSA